MSARRLEIGLRPGDTFIVHVSAVGDDGAKVRLLAETLGDHGAVEVMVAVDGFTVELFDGTEIRAHGWVASA